MRNNKGQFQKGHAIFPQNPFVKGNKLGPKFKPGYTPWNKGKQTGGLTANARIKVSQALKGKKLTDEHRNKLRKPKLGGASQYWFGTASAYKALHYLIGKKFGKPQKCERCKKDGLTGRKIHWANKSKKYSLERKDWMRLCTKCHAFYDKKKDSVLKRVMESL